MDRLLTRKAQFRYCSEPIRFRKDLSADSFEKMLPFSTDDGLFSNDVYGATCAYA